jgi:Tol biopolymer transport system component
MTKALPISLLFSLAACSHVEPKHDTIDYPGDLAAKERATLFVPGIISTDGFEHSAPSFSPDGKTVLWAIMELPSWKARILEMDYENGKWGTPYVPSFADTSASDIYPAFSSKGDILYFSSDRKLPGGKKPEKGNVIWKVDWTKNGWGTPERLDSTVSGGGQYSPSVANNGNLYFTHGPFRSPDWNILKSEKAKGSLSAPLPVSINSTGYEDGPFVAPDESYLIFESDREGGFEGSIDLYIAFKSESGDWRAPVNMGPKVNSGAAERFARVSPDGKYLFFGSNRRQINGQPNFDIYFIDAKVVEELRQLAVLK